MRLRGPVRAGRWAVFDAVPDGTRDRRDRAIRGPPYHPIAHPSLRFSVAPEYTPVTGSRRIAW